MHELLFGGPHDSPAKTFRAIDQLRTLKRWVIGITVGLTVFPNPARGDAAGRDAGANRPCWLLHTGEPTVDPTFYVEPTSDSRSGRRSESIRRARLQKHHDPELGKPRTNDQLINSERVRQQVVIEKLKGPCGTTFQPEPQ
jgi:hypothetical protein